MIHKLLKSEIKNLSLNPDYWGSKENVTNENNIFDWFLSHESVTQEWFDDRIKYTSIERLKELEQEYKN